MNRLDGRIFFRFLGFCILLLAVAVGMNVKNVGDTAVILTQSIESQLRSVSLAARGMIDPEVVRSYDTSERILQAARTSDFQRVVFKLRAFAESVGMEGIYVIRPINGAYYVIYDTDPVRPATGRTYALSPVHEEAFAGTNASHAMSVAGENGSFNASAVPIFYGDTVIAVIAANTSDTLLRTYTSVARTNMILQASVIGTTLLGLCAFIYALLARARRMQDSLGHLAHYDILTNLPNRQYLLNSLADATRAPSRAAFALYFIDLDNFKRVNDTAGHDAGDALLFHAGGYFLKARAESKVFRPAPGGLNIAARTGGDEFVIVVPGIATPEDAMGYGDELVQGFKTELIDRHIKACGIGLSIGVALYPFHSENHHVLIQYADIALYHAKRAGRNCCRVYEENMPGKREK